MPIKESTYKKHCLVVDEWFVNGMNGTKAYQKFYPGVSDETAKVNFSKILTIANVSEYRESQFKTFKNDYNVDKDNLIKELKQVIERFNVLYELASTDKLDPLQNDKFKRLSQMFKASDLIKAIERISKMTGLDTPTEVTGKDGKDLNNVTLVVQSTIIAPLTSEKEVENKYGLDSDD